MQLGILTIGEVGSVAGEVTGDLAYDTKLLDGQDPAVDSLLALGKEAPIAQATMEVVSRDRVETLLGINLLNAGPHVERVILELELLVRVQRLKLTQGPLTYLALVSALVARPT